MRAIRFLKNIPLLGRWLHALQWAVLRRLPKAMVLRMYRDPTDWNRLERELERFLAGNARGVSASARTPELIVSLTSYPPRIARIHYTVFTLLTQTLKPDRVVLWLAEEQFPGRDDDLTPELRAMREHGLTIRYTHDTKSYKKLVPAVSAFPNAAIVTVDDDLLFPQDMLERLVRSWQGEPSGIHTHRANRITGDAGGTIQPYARWERCIDGRAASRRKHGAPQSCEHGDPQSCEHGAPQSCEHGDPQSGFAVFLTGGAGTLYPPGALHPDLTREDLFMRLSPTADDVWFWAMAVLNDTKTCVVRDNILSLYSNDKLRYEDVFAARGLYAVNLTQNDVQIQNVLEHYPEIAEKLREEFFSREYSQGNFSKRARNFSKRARNFSKWARGERRGPGDERRGAR